ncbi:MAG: hypothetical protein JW738_07685 [Actinobacteria bacterium]|nr:hypothetical protein [Actinomycetota bacterium]
MKVFDLGGIALSETEGRAVKVFHKIDEYSARVIELPPLGRIPECEMASNLLFFVIHGEVEISVDGKTEKLRGEQCLVAGPGTFSMYSESGVRLLGIQISGLASNPY